MLTVLMSLAMLAGMALVWFSVLPGLLVWAVPCGVFLFGALAALVLWWRSRAVGVADGAAARTVDDVDQGNAARTPAASAAEAPGGTSGGLSATGFQHMVAEAFRRRGYRVIVRKGGPDLNASADLILEHDGQRYFVQCGLWKTGQVGVLAIRKLHAHVQAAGVDGGYIVTTGSFTAEARRLARESGIVPVDGVQLRHLMRGSKA